MMTINPYSALAETVPAILIQGFVLLMLGLILFGTIIQMIHHKNLTYFFNNAKKAKLSAERELGAGERAAIIANTVVHDIAPTCHIIVHIAGVFLSADI